MTKFGESRKTGLSDFLFRTIRFWQFQDKIKEWAKFKDLKIQGVLRNKKGLESVKKPRWKKSSQKPKPQKPDRPVLDIRVFDFPRTDRVRLGFDI
jgi:hypothetical protein